MKGIINMVTSPKPESDNLKVYWSNEDDCFVCESNDYPDIIGIGETESEALQTYYELLEEYLKDLKKGKVIKNKIDRPKKSNSKITYNVSTNIKAFIELESLRNNVNQGVILEKIVNFYQEAHKEELSRYYEDV
jgi:predicted RNase H-like HicB family nuclease